MPRRVAVAVAVGVGLVVAPPAAGAQPRGAADVRLALVDQAFAIGAGERWSATFRLDGDSAAAVPPTSTTTTTTPTTTTAPAAPTTTSQAATPPPATAAAVTATRGATPSTARATTPPGPDVAVRVGVHRLVDDRAELDAALAGERTTILDVLTVEPNVQLDDDGTTTLSVDVPTSPDIGVTSALSLRRPGLYPLTVTLLVDGEEVDEAMTVVERLPLQGAGGAPMAVALLAAAPDPGPAPTDDQVAEGRSRLGRIAQLAAAVDAPITAAVPPVLVDGLADADERDLDAPGAPDPELAAALATSLDGDEVLAVPADVLDPSSAVAIDAREDFVRELRRGEDVLAAALPGAPPQRAAWLVPTELSAGAASMLDGLGFRSLVLTSDVYDGLDGSIQGFHDWSLTTQVDLGRGTSMPGLVLAPAGALLDPARQSRAGVGPVDAAVRITAELLLTRRELGPELRRSAVLTTPAGTVPDAETSAAVARFVSSLPDFRVAPLSALPGGTDPMVLGEDGPERVQLPDVAGPDLSERARRIGLTRAAAAATASMLPDDTQLEEWRDELDTLLSTGLTDEQVDGELERISAETIAVRSAVEAPPPFTFTLTGRSSPLRLNFRNTGDDPLRVVVRPSSPKLTFPDGDQLVDLLPGAVTEVVVPVEARSNGTSAIGIEVLTPALDQEVVDPVVLTARVNAITGLGQVVTGAAFVVLLTWWFGHFRRRRRLPTMGPIDEPPFDPVDVSPDAAETVAVAHHDDHDHDQDHADARHR